MVKNKDLTDEQIEKRNAYNRAWRAKNPDKLKAYRKKYNEENQGTKTAYQAIWVKNNPEKQKANEAVWRANLKLDAMIAYGGPRCSNPECHVPGGETNIDELTIDHSFGDGKAHREKIFGDSTSNSGHHFYKWLRRNDYPQDLGLRVLCKKCNSKQRTKKP